MVKVGAVLGTHALIGTNRQARRKFMYVELWTSWKYYLDIVHNQGPAYLPRKKIESLEPRC